MSHTVALEAVSKLGVTMTTNRSIAAVNCLADSVIPETARGPMALSLSGKWQPRPFTFRDGFYILGGDASEHQH